MVKQLLVGLECKPVIAHWGGQWTWTLDSTLSYPYIAVTRLTLNYLIAPISLPFYPPALLIYHSSIWLTNPGSFVGAQ